MILDSLAVFDTLIVIFTILTPTMFKDAILATDLMKVYQYGFGN